MKKESYEIIIRSVSGITTRIFRKTWCGAVRCISRLESTCPNIWSDAYIVEIISLDGELIAIDNLIK